MQFIFFVNHYKIWSPNRNYVIYFYLNFLDNCKRLILKYGFCFVNIPFGSMVKFKFLAKFPMDLFSHLIMSSLIFLLR